MKSTGSSTSVTAIQWNLVVGFLSSLSEYFSGHSNE